MASKPPDYNYVAYIDESGDPGLTKVKPRTPGGSSEWLVISAAVIPAECEPEVQTWVAEMMKAMNSHQLRDLHFQKLRPDKKSLLCSYLAQRRVKLFTLISNKQNMEGYHNPRAAKVPSNNWFYCWLTRVLLERVTGFVLAASIKRYNEPRLLKLEYSERGGLSYSQMHAYYEWLKIKGAGGAVPQFLPWGDLAWPVLHQDLMYVYNHKERDGLKLPDIAASAFFKAVDVHDTGACDASFAKLLAPAIARSPDSNMACGYGVKLMPNWKTLDRFAVPEEQRAILRFYGYPGKQWWQKVVDPGPV
ncbi:DUF3800 domain-containing protein [Rhizorhabdus dicambivorans]|uniref:DUF3800 domain-containing protein n=1 Tax=Rhizorhabdus dicambivorans TaxID=1850238 RepID=A0A2A4FU56_9SPHN|nr:DUF3800 domain-containing protein [Rhizorhabdus dicambivorans]ATE65637.1 DUF3800 domain-containing protein [Rhizorhabdus dicambivorans]PCE40978.1 DUF3800 domain-containing protein [Rhizorhabdus dicambivorans]